MKEAGCLYELIGGLVESPRVFALDSTKKAQERVHDFWREKKRTAWVPEPRTKNQGCLPPTTPQRKAFRLLLLLREQVTTCFLLLVIFLYCSLDFKRGGRQRDSTWTPPCRSSPCSSIIDHLSFFSLKHQNPHSNQPDHLRAFTITNSAYAVDVLSRIYLPPSPPPKREACRRGVSFLPSPLNSHLQT